MNVLKLFFTIAFLIRGTQILSMEIQVPISSVAHEIRQRKDDPSIMQEVLHASLVRAIEHVQHSRIETRD